MVPNLVCLVENMVETRKQWERGKQQEEERRMQEEEMWKQWDEKVKVKVLVQVKVQLVKMSEKQLEEEFESWKVKEHDLMSKIPPAAPSGPSAAGPVSR